MTFLQVRSGAWSSQWAPDGPSALGWNDQGNDRELVTPGRLQLVAGRSGGRSSGCCGAVLASSRIDPFVAARRIA
jgi:hypothetical protein